MQKFILAALLLLLFLPSCMVVHHSVGNAPPKKAPNTQTYSTTHHWFLFWGLIPLNRKQEIPIPSNNYRMRSASGGVDILLTILTAGIVSGRTTKIIAYRNNNNNNGGGGGGNNTVCGLDEQRFQSSMGSLRSANMMQDKRDAAMRLVQANDLSCNQIRTVVKELEMDLFKKEVLIAAYSRCCDKQNFEPLISMVSMSMHQQDIRKATIDR